jgi:hypothetical protein
MGFTCTCPDLNELEAELEALKAARDPLCPHHGAQPTTPPIPEPTEDHPVFYLLPAGSMTEGMSTNDGQDILDLGGTANLLIGHVYTPADDPDEDLRRRCAPEARGFSSPDQPVSMADFVNTRTPGRGHPDALIELTLCPQKLWPGDQVRLDAATHPDRAANWRTVSTVTQGATDPNPDPVHNLGTCFMVELRGSGTLHTNHRSRFQVRRPSGHILERLASELVRGCLYRNVGDVRFFDVEDVEKADDEVTVFSSNGNEACYDTSAVVEVWQPCTDAV